MSKPTLTVAIATMGTRVTALSPDQLPAIAGVDYHIFIQALADPAKVSGFATRSDISVTALNTLGVTHSRNAAIAGAKGDLILFADDDLSLATENYQTLVDLFATTVDLGFICGRLQDAKGTAFKSYPPDGTAATRLNTARLGTPELAIRAAFVRDAGVGFDTDFGAGSANWLGDEYIFACDCLRAGLKGRHIGLHLATHAQPSSGQDRTAASMPVRKAALQRALGSGSWPYRVAFAIKHRKKFDDMAGFLRFISLR